MDLGERSNNGAAQPAKDRYRILHLLREKQELLSTRIEDHWFERKSIKIEASALANVLVGFANADGGTIVIGVEKDGTITGIGRAYDQVNKLRQAALDYTQPPVRHIVEELPCLNTLGEEDRVLVIEVHPSEQLHRNHKGEVYRRVGDQTRRLSEEEARELAFDKGERVFDGLPIPEMTLDDLDPTALHEFARLIGAGEDVERALRVRGLLIARNGELVPTWGAILLFGKNPQTVLPGALLRILRYEGLRSRPGVRSNLVFDRRIHGRLPLQIAEAREVMHNQLRQLTRLDEVTGQFVTISELPEFAWLEAIVNAVTHRSYSLHGDYIRVMIFDDRVEIESPGRLPGSVRIDNIRRTRFSRNPHISRTLADLRIVQELNEGMNRMFEEMILAGLPEPELHQTDSGFRVILYKVNETERSQVFAIAKEAPEAFAPALDRLFDEGRLSTSEASRLTGLSLPTVRRYLRNLEERGLLERVARSPKDPHAYWQPPRPWRGRWRLHDVLESVRTRKLTRNN